MPHTAVMIAETGWIVAAVMREWLRAGNRIAEIWCFDENSPYLRPSPGITGRLFPNDDAARLARRHRIPVRLCPKLRGWDGCVPHAASLDADVLFTLMTHQIVPAALLAHFGRRAINLHPALLPHYKGPSPRLGMLLDGQGDSAGGITFHVLTPGIDEGPIIAQRRIPASSARDGLEWEMLHAQAAAEMVVSDVLPFLDGTREPEAQIPGTGNYRRVAPTEVELSPALTAARIRQLCGMARQATVLRWTLEETGGGKREVKISGFWKEVGPPTGAGPRLSPVHMEIDVADARIRLWRRHAGTRLRTWVRKLGLLRIASRRRAGMERAR